MIKKVVAELQDVSFSHLHNRTQFSVLQSTIQVKNLINKAVEYNMPAVAFSDNGNMMAAFQFVETAAKHNSQIDQKIEALQKEEEEKIKDDTKLNRDLERKKTKREINKEIKKRKEDFSKYIVPQQTSSDINIKTILRDEDKVSFDIFLKSQYFFEFKILTFVKDIIQEYQKQR